MTDQGRMLYSAAQVREGEKELAATLGIEMYELMERAGKSVFECLQHCYPHAKSIHVFCGGGNNGGDGYVVARLAKSEGYRVTLTSVVDSTTLTGDAARAKALWLQAEGRICSLAEFKQIEGDVIVDALLGTGLTGTVRADYQQLITTINNSGIDLVSVDIPSGLCADTGATLGECIKAQYTVSFIALKQGLYTAQASAYTGEVLFSGLQISDDFSRSYPSNIHLIEKHDVDNLLVSREKTSHKGDHGRVLCMGGDRGMFGAIRLASEAVIRTGAGLVKVLTQPENVSAMVSARPELMVYDWRGNSNEINDHLDWADVLLLGPGVGQASWGRSLVGYSRGVEKPVIQDADGLNLLAKTPDFNSRRVITPHPGEAARLLNVSVEEIQSNRFKSAKKLQRRYGGVVVLKGPGTIVFDGSDYWVCQQGNPGMATGGMGDVLTGVIAGLIAQGLSLSDASKVAVWIHSAAADICAEREGERGLAASDLFPLIRQLVNRL